MRHADYDVWRCPTCKSFTTSPQPTAGVLQDFYAGYNDDYTGGMGSRYAAEMPKRLEYRLARIVALGGRGDLLDLAGSNGLFGQIASEHGFNVSVADFISEERDLGFTTAVPADLSVIGGVPFDDASADVVTLWSCLEHVADPSACLAEIYRLARPGALIAIDTPLVGDVCEQLFPAATHWVSPPEHLTTFSAPGLRAAVTAAGFDVLDHHRFAERSRLRWMARRGRNIAVATKGVAIRLRDQQTWVTRRETETTAAGDIQILYARRPSA